MGCYERTLAWLIEKYAGMFPTWLCPEQVRVIPISEKFNAYADKVEAQMKEEGIRCSVDRRSEKMGYKIREARLKSSIHARRWCKRRGRGQGFRKKPLPWR